MNRLLVAATLVALASAQCTMPSVRPAPKSRYFRIEAVEELIESYGPKFSDPNLSTLFANCLPNTLDTTVYKSSVAPGAEDAFVITGDITAMWIRDSANQVAPYIALASTDPNATALIRGVIRRQAQFVTLDPFANAFQLEGSLPSPHTDDSTSYVGFAGSRIDGMGPLIFERKFEVDTLSNFLHLSAQYFKATGDTSVFVTDLWVDAVQTVLETLTAQQLSSAQEGSNPPYLFQRTTGQPSDTLEDGRGAPAAYTGMIKTGFRPSDDAHVLPFNIPVNAFASVALRGVASVLTAVDEPVLANVATTLAGQVEDGIAAYGVINHPKAGEIYAYEVDGFGSYYFMDDGNIPSLLSMPYFGFATLNDTLYKNTRAAVLSAANPYYFTGSVVSGVGSPHTGPGRVWPMAVMTRAYTSDNVTEIAQAVETLVTMSACSGLMHESVNVNNAGDYTRPWFAWANSLFAGLIIKIAATNPSIIFG